ncbi:MAG: hypothetical protein HN348_35455, partial [Proteobacteria bacterium]|nr:hypothetical protein [Pseudomonadota bacterium]
MRALLTWELGAGFGHLCGLGALAHSLNDRGVEVVAALRSPHLGGDFFPAGTPLLQAPFWRKNTGWKHPPMSLAEVIGAHGFNTPAQLEPLIGAWRSLVGRVQPQIVVFDYAPTAMVATRGLDMVRAFYSNSFFFPPALKPAPGFKADAPEAELLRHERQVVSGANSAIKAFAVPPLTQFADLFDLDLPLLRCFPEMDHYHRDNGLYVGSVFNSLNLSQAAPSWPQTGGPKRVFAYLHGAFPQVEGILRCLVASKSKVVAVVTDEHDLCDRVKAPNLVISRQ